MRTRTAHLTRPRAAAVGAVLASALLALTACGGSKLAGEYYDDRGSSSSRAPA